MKRAAHAFVVLGITCLFATPTVAQTPQWTLRATTGPSARSSSAMVYDNSRGVVMLFGGSAGPTNFGDTWTWSGSAWFLLSPGTSPSARNQHAMAFDTARGVAVLFGGNMTNDTYEWNGTTWSLKNPANRPSGRSGHAMAYDAARSRTILFGGKTGSGYSNQTWAWDGTNWTQLSPANSPSARNQHAMAYDSLRQVVVLFGGYTGSANLGDTWEWNGSNWTQRSSVNNPAARYSHGMTFDPARDVTVMFGGELGSSSSNNPAGDTWEWNGTVWTQRSPTTSPPARESPIMAYDAASGKPLLFGGAQGGSNYVGDTWDYGLVGTSSFAAGNYFTANGNTVYEFAPSGSQVRTATIPGLPGGTQVFVWGFTPDQRLIVSTDKPGGSENVFELDASLTVAKSYSMSGGPSNSWVTNAVVGPDNRMYAVYFSAFSPSGPNTVYVFDRTTGVAVTSFQTTGQEGVCLDFHSDGYLYIDGWGSRDFARYQSTSPYSRVGGPWPLGGPTPAGGKVRSGPNNHLFITRYSSPSPTVAEYDVTSIPSSPSLVRSYSGFQSFNFDFNPTNELVIATSASPPYQFLRYSTINGQLLGSVNFSPNIQPNGLAVFRGPSGCSSPGLSIASVTGCPSAPVNPGATLSGTVSGNWWRSSSAPNSSLRLVCGWRRSDGTWTGPTPAVLGASGSPSTCSPGDSFGTRSWTIHAPATTGAYAFWICVSAAADDAHAIQEFKSRTITNETVRDKQLCSSVSISSPTVTVGASYDPVSHILSVTARAFDPLSGTYVTQGSASFIVDPFVSSHPMTFSGTEWHGTTSIILNPGDIATIRVTVQSLEGTTTIVIPPVGYIWGSVSDTQGNALSADIALYRSVDFERPGADPLLTTHADSTGIFDFASVTAGYYVVTASAPSFDTAAIPIHISANASYPVHFHLSQTGVSNGLVPLVSTMNLLYEQVISTMEIETARLSEATQQAAETFNHTFTVDEGYIIEQLGRFINNVWPHPSWVADVVDLGPRPGFVPTANWTSVFGNVLSGALLTVITEGVRYQISEDTLRTLPAAFNQWRLYSLGELQAFISYAQPSEQLLGLKQVFAASAASIPVAADFDYAKARLAIASQKQLLYDLAQGKVRMFLPLARADRVNGPPGTCVSGGLAPVPLSSSLSSYRAADIRLAQVGAARQVTSSLVLAGYVTAGGLAITGIGAGAAPLAMTVAAAAGTTGQILALAELPLLNYVASTYVAAVRDWATEMQVMPTIYSDVQEFLIDEASAPNYLATSNTFSALVVGINMGFDEEGQGVGYNRLCDTHEDRQAVISLRNTSTTAAVFRVFGTSIWEEDDPVSLRRQQVTFMGAIGGGPNAAIEPNETWTVQLPYRTVLDQGSRVQQFRVDVYAGPYWVAGSAPVLFHGLAKSPEECPYGLASARRVVDCRPSATVLLDSILDAATPSLEVNYTCAPSAESAAFYLFSQFAGSAGMEVEDSVGRRASYDPSIDSWQAEFAAETTSLKATGQAKIEVSQAEGAQYLVRAVLAERGVTGSVPVQIWVVETPACSGALTVSPPIIQGGARAGQPLEIGVSVGESVGQSPLSNVSVTIGEIRRDIDGQILNRLSPDGRVVDLIPAGQSIDIAFQYEVPLGMPGGNYSGSIVVEAGSGESQVVPVLIEVYTPGDLTSDGAVNGTDFSVLLGALGCCRGAGCYRRDADYDGDDCVTFVDYQIWLQFFRSGEGDPLSQPPIPADVGDINGDGRIDGQDIQGFLNTMLSPSTAGFRSRIVADLNGDGVINESDVQAFLDRLLGAAQ